MTFPVPLVVRILLSSYLLGGAAMLAAQSAGGDTALADLGRELRDRCAAGTFSGVVVVQRGEDRLFDLACGTADLVSGAPVGFDTRFKIASITKPLTATAILELAEQGRLSIDDRLLAHIPEAPPGWAGIRIRHLLQHTSGLPDRIDRMIELRMPRGEAVRTVLRELGEAGSAPAAPPGEIFAYANFNYELLAEIVARKTGLNFPEAMRRLVFAPAGMDGATIEAAGVRDPKMAFGHFGAPESMQRVEPDAEVAWAFAGSGSAQLSVADMLAWHRAMDSGALLNAESRRRAVEEGIEVAPGVDQALVGLTRTVGGEPVWFQWGAIDGFKPYFGRVPGRGIAVIVLTNLNEVKPNLLGTALLEAAIAHSRESASARSGGAAGED